ncbi:MAG: ABC transporter ATP-binding protein [Caldilineaceae bacterium]
MQIHLEQIEHIYRSQQLDERTVLAIDEWIVPTGQQLLLRGISGSGKTTLMNIIAGLLPPTSGQVWLDDQAIYQLREAQRDRFRAQHIGYVFQIHLLVPTLSALENVELPLIFAQQLASAERRARATAILNQIGLGDHLRHRPVQMSAGQRLRVAVARALVNRPRILLADEPTAALDPANAAAVMDLLQQLCRQQNATLFVASHDPTLAQRFDSVVDLEMGRLKIHNHHDLSAPEAAPCSMT